jgi:GDP/UDP-N,N'-diacetylbacillosamine 2-epimerase (hydrolysing)
MKKILVFSAGRSDFDRYYPFLNSLKNTKKTSIKIYVSKAHLVNKFGNSANYILKKGFSIINNLNLKKSFFKDDSFFISRILGEEIKSFAEYIKKFRPDLIFVMGDRYEMLAAPSAAIPFNIPVIHFYGGAITEGATDELVRHAITKMCHFHFVALDIYKERLIQMGEESWRVRTIGIPNINNLKRNIISIKKISKIIGLNLKQRTILCNFHSSTLELDALKNQLNILFNAIRKSKLQCVFTYPNADLGHNLIIDKIKQFVKENKKYIFKKYCTVEEYSGLLKYCSVMIGNSSSGIVESCSFNLPTINLGIRQKGKVHPKNVINSKYNANNLCKLLLSLKKKKHKNPYESRFSVKKITNIILNLKISDKLLKKKFISIY